MRCTMLSLKHKIVDGPLFPLKKKTLKQNNKQNRAATTPRFL